MLTIRFPTLRRFLIKMIEVAGAGCASAIAAFLLGHSHEAERPPMPMPVPPAVVHLAPADEQMIRYVKQYQDEVWIPLRREMADYLLSGSNLPAEP